MKDCKVAICEWSLPIKGPSMFKVAKELGLDGIQIDDWSSWEHSFPMSNKAVQQQYLSAAAENGMSIPSIGCNGFSRLGGFVNRLGTFEGDMSVKALLKTREICEEMNIPLAMFPCCWSGFIRTEEDLENAADMLRKVCRYYDDSPVDIAMESVLTPEQYAELFRYVGSKSLKIYYDTQNTQYSANAFPPEEMQRINIGDVAEIHFKDGFLKAQGCVFYGDGETGFSEMVQVLKEKEYNGWCVIENFYMKPSWTVTSMDPLQCIAVDVKRLKNAFAG